MTPRLPPAPSPERPPLSDVQLRRMEFRIGLFKRRGWPESAAEAWACRLVQRDSDRDERRLCMECEHLQRHGGCFMAKKLPIHKPEFYKPLTDVLQRCERFAFLMP